MQIRLMTILGAMALFLMATPAAFAQPSTHYLMSCPLDLSSLSEAAALKRIHDGRSDVQIDLGLSPKFAEIAKSLFPNCDGPYEKVMFGAYGGTPAEQLNELANNYAHLGATPVAKGIILMQLMMRMTRGTPEWKLVYRQAMELSSFQNHMGTSK